MDMKLRKIIRDFVNWQGKNDMLKDELTIDYEVAETYLEQTNLTFCSSSLQLNEKQIPTFEDWLTKNCKEADDGRYFYKGRSTLKSTLRDITYKNLMRLNL